MRRKFPVPRIVQPADFRTRAVVLGFLILVIGVTLVFAFQFGRMQAGYHAVEAQRKVGDLRQQLTVQREKNVELRRDVEVLRGSREINLGAIKALKTEILSLQEERLEQEQEMAVLRNVLANGGVKGELKIQDFELRATEPGGRYGFKFTVSQKHKDFGVASGTIEISVSGRLNGKEKAFTLAEISEERAAGVKMRFRHFQNVTGNIQLPADFEPASFKIDVKPESEGLLPVSRTFSWPKDRA